MIRSLLQFVGFASTAVWSTLLVGILFMSPTTAKAALAPGTSSCADCYVCNAQNTGCNYRAGALRGYPVIFACVSRYLNGFGFIDSSFFNNLSMR